MMELSWELIGYEELLKQNNLLIQEITEITIQFKSGLQQVVKSCLVKLESKLLNYVKPVYMKKRNPATHLMIFICDQLRNSKPYAMPVKFESEIEDAMVAVNVVTVGKHT